MMPLMSQTAIKSDRISEFRRRKKRFRRAEISADIEGLARNEATFAMRKQWLIDGVPVNQQIEMLKAFYASK